MTRAATAHMPPCAVMAGLAFVILGIAAAQSTTAVDNPVSPAYSATLFYSKGYPGQADFDLGAAAADSSFASNLVFRRRCSSCVASYQTIYYKRITLISPGWSMYTAAVQSWTTNNAVATPGDGWAQLLQCPENCGNNLLNIDFELYSTFDDLVNGANRWTYCNYNGQGVGFPRDCGPSMSQSVGGQWSDASGIHNNYDFSIIIGAGVSLVTGLPQSGIPPGVAACMRENRTMEEIVRGMREEGFFQGGLGGMSNGTWETWGCWRKHACLDSIGLANKGEAVCYKLNSADGSWMLWGLQREVGVGCSDGWSGTAKAPPANSSSRGGTLYPWPLNATKVKYVSGYNVRNGRGKRGPTVATETPRGGFLGGVGHGGLEARTEPHGEPGENTGGRKALSQRMLGMEARTVLEQSLTVATEATRVVS